MRTGSTALRSIVDILVAGGLDERIEEITRPASAEHGPILPLLRHANRLTRELSHLAACQLATARALDHSLAGRVAASTPAPTQPSPDTCHPRRRGMVRLNLTSLLVLLAMAAYAGFLIGAGIAYRPPPPPFELPAPSRPAPLPAAPPADRINAALAPPAASAPRMPDAS